MYARGGILNIKLLELSELALTSVKKYTKKRFLFDDLNAELKNKSILILSGPRGVGKTILMKQLIFKFKKSFYLSVDQLDADESLFDIAKKLQETYKIKYLILDEIHYNHQYAADLKAIYDFLNLKVLVTSSIALKLEELSHDLSRRAKYFQLYPFSFREYIYFDQNKLLPQLSLKLALNKKWSSSHVKYGYLFKDYLQGRLYPFTLDEVSYQELFKNILNKIIKVDLPQIGKLTPQDIIIVEKIIAHIGRSGSEGISFSSISKNIGISKYIAEQFVILLSKAFLLQIIYPKGANVLREPKILMGIPFRQLFKDYEDAVGAIREDFVVEILRAQGVLDISYLKSTRGEKIPDFLITSDKGEEIVIEVGGRGKGRSQFKGIEIEQKYIVVDSLDWKENQIPLFMLGMF
jgi:predicted AAA+ superfamily ATPase